MAERIQVELVDDLDGSPARYTVTFGLDGTSYEIDLSEQHNRALRSMLGRYIDHARRDDDAATDSATSTEKKTKRQEREEREARQANRQLTEHIRGVAQRSRERARQAQEQQAATSEEAAAEPADGEQPVLDFMANPAREKAGDRSTAPQPDGTDSVSERTEDSAEQDGTDARRKVALPQFSAARD